MEPRIRGAADYVARLAREWGVSREAVVIGWILRHPARIQPVVGTTNPDRIRAAFDGRKRERRGAGDSLGVFWEPIHDKLADARVMPTDSGGWAVVKDTVLPARNDPPEWVALLGEIGIRQLR